MQKRIYSVISALLLLGSAANAEPPVRVQNFEGEIRLGISSPLKNLADEENCAGIDAGVEVRYNLPKAPVAIGVMADLYNPRRTSDKWGGASESYGGFMAGVTGEYNFRRGKNINPVACIGLGIANFNDGEFWGTDGTSNRAFFRPKIGVELWHHLRIGFSITISDPKSSGWSMSVGAVIGGRPRKTK